jgi:lysophospholipase L1-like esterase
MAVTQYIGARYVPLFAEPLQWDSSKSYEPLTIVYNEGNSYTSRQFVPAGILISNEEYWALTGNYNAQIEQYRTEVARFDERITQNANGIATKAPISHASTATTYGVGSSTNYGHVKLYNAVGAQTDGAITPNAVQAVRTEVGTKAPISHASTATTYGVGNSTNYGHVKLYNAVGAQTDGGITPNAVQAALADIQTHTKTVLLTIGDSYGDITPQERSWAYQLSKLIPGCTLHNYCVSGAGWNVDGKKFENQLQQAASDKLKPNLIVICGGRNDIITERQARAAVDNCFSVINNNWPDAKVVVAPYLYDSTPLSNDDKLECSYVCNELANFKAIVLNHAWTWLKGRTDCFPSSDIHPNEKGAKIIADFLYQGIEGSYNGRFEQGSVNFAGAPANFTLSNGVVTFQIGGDISNYASAQAPGWARPSTNTAYICYTNSGTATKVGFIDSSGLLSIYGASGNIGGVGGSCSYSA